MVKKKYTLLLSITIASLFVWIYLHYPGLLQRFDNSLRDQLFLFRGEIGGSREIVIVDIDEKSLALLGQWPWSRDKLARIVKNLTAAKAGVIGFDIVFSEKDRTSPKSVADMVGLSEEDRKKLPDYDRIFAETIGNAPVVLGFVFNFNTPLQNPPPPVSAIYVEKGSVASDAGLLEAKGVVPNLQIFQERACCSGSFNMVPDDDGIVRYVPMLIRYDSSIYPSISFEIFRALTGVRKVVIEEDEMGVDSILLGETRIPVDSFGRLLVNYRGGRGSYRYLSAADIYENRFDSEAIADKVVLVGTSASGLLDMRAIPFDSTIPGVEIHANVLDNLIHQDFLQRPSFVLLLDIGSVFVSAMAAWMILSFLPPFAALGALVVLLGGVLGGLYKMMFSGGFVLAGIYPLLTLVSVSLVLFVYRLFGESKSKERIREKFSKKVSSQVADLLIESEELDLGPQEREVSIFFSDIRGFTTLSERLGSATELIAFLNCYMSPMSDIIIQNSGTIDKYIGDAIMAYWNAPIEIPGHADLALTSALQQLEALEKLNIELQKEGKMPISIGIGIHTDIAIVGEMGSEGRSDFTIIGDSVNLCSRIEGLTKVYGAGIIITEQTRAKLRQKYRIIELDRVAVKGKEIPVTIYEVTGFGAFDESEMRMVKRYEEGLGLYRSARFEEALVIFEQLFAESGKALFGFYCGRCRDQIQKREEMFDGVYRYDTK
ncbi:MAG: hypothetical protein B6D59_04070 [Campylobacteraceae bacterium 4484_4]|nr:MAG: hypothetical protein B6D59_04070 [Campylobacteraceae bacterium 4484_4]